MSLPLLLIIIGIVLAVLVPSLYALGIVLILIGLVLLIVPYVRGGANRRI